MERKTEGHARDHPRTRGEKFSAGTRLLSAQGSPPHTRGKEDWPGASIQAYRITPAHAGKRRRDAERGAAGKDHPRTRGEKSGAAPVQIAQPPSPPHTRGKVRQRRLGRPRQRITPAHAGKSRLPEDGLARPEDHPRTRGEKVDSTEMLVLVLGSPPHTRGKEPNQPFLFASTWITPAHAGKSAVSVGIVCRGWDHPRTRGEKWSEAWRRTGRLGSPPHTRGKAKGLFYHDTVARITPAHAGKRPRSWGCPGWAEDHPRTRGEKALEEGL